MPISGNTVIEKQPLEIKRNAQYNLEEIKVRWKKAALENCPGVPCVVEPVTPPAPALACGSVSSVNDVDLNTYTTVSIGTQCWTKENLKVTRYNDNTLIPLNNTYTSGSVSTVWQGLTDGAYTIYNNEASSGANATNYGFLYNWYAAKGVSTSGSTIYKNICPTGWHVPADSDWNKLVKYIDSGADTSGTVTQSIIAGGKMKSIGTSYWDSPNTGADNSSGFNALPGGFRNSAGTFISIRIFAFFWSTDESHGNSLFRMLLYFDSNVARNINYKSVGGSIRCLMD